MHVPDNENYVTHKHLADALKEFGAAFKAEMREVAAELRSQIAADRGEFKTHLTAARPQSTTIAAWASVTISFVAIIGAMIFFHLNSQRTSDIAAQVEFHRMQEEKQNQINRLLISQNERNENLRDADNEDIKRRYRDSLAQPWPKCDFK